jgi:geranylgeranyl diphosphate synthase, type II
MRAWSKPNRFTYTPLTNVLDLVNSRCCAHNQGMLSVVDPQPHDRASAADPSSRAAALPVAIKAALEQALDRALPITGPDHGPTRLLEAMRFSLLAPAKRVRGILSCLAAQQFGGAQDAAHGIAVAIEMVHAASLILDDLPCMDNAAMRRGRPACHKMYGEDTASLAAVGLMSQATLHLARDANIAPALRVRLIADLAHAIGNDGLIGGQEQDLHEARLGGTGVSVVHVEAMHRRKTGVLFSLAAEAGALVVGANEGASRHMHGFGAALGLAFQTYDDLLDVHATMEAAGKDVGQDASKVTVVTLLGVQRARARANAHVTEALAHLQAAGGDGGPTISFVKGLIDQLAARAPKISGG